MIQDYLDAKEQENFFKEITARKKVGSKITIRKSTISVNSLLKEKQKSFEPMEKDLKELNQTSSVIGNSIKGIADSYKLLAVAVLAAGAALFGAVKYLNSIQGGTGLIDGFQSSGRSTGKLSEKGKKFIANEEGLKTKAYQDSRGVWTIGIGHTGKVDGKPVGPGMEITEAKAYELFNKDIEKFENYVNKVVKVPVSQNMFDAMVSYAYNVGSLGPNFLKKLNSGDYKGAAAELTTINKELQGRRAREQSLFLSDVNNDNTLKVEAINNEIPKQIQSTSAGNLNRYKNGAKIGNFTMSNPAASRKYIDLSDRALAYLKDVKGSGYITSGAEGNHAKGVVSHASGNKIDVVAYKQSLEGWADTALPFAQNKNTAYINFEDFSKSEFQQIKELIYKKDPSLRQKGESRNPGGYMNGANYFCNINTGGGKHLDIGILPNAYTNTNVSNVNQGNQTKPQEIPKQQSKPQSTPTQKPSTTPPAKNVNPPSSSTNTQETVNLNKPKLNNTTSKKK